MAQVEVEAFQRPMTPERAVDRSSPVVVQKIERASEVVQEVGRRVTQDAFDRGADVVEMWWRTGDEVPHDVGRLVGEIAKACFALGEADLGDVSLGDIASDG